MIPVDASDLIITVNDVADLAVDQGFCFPDQVDEVVFIDIAGQEKIDLRGIESI